MIIIFIRAIILFAVLLLVFRLMGKRQIGEMEPFELVITLVISELACIPMADRSIPITFGSGPNGKGKLCKNMRVIYLLRSGDFMPIQLSLPPTSIRPYTDFVNTAFLARRRGVCGSVVQIGLKKMNNGKDDYSVATFRKLYDFTGEELAQVRAYANSFKEQVKMIQDQRMADWESNTGSDIEVGQPARTMPDNTGHFAVGSGVVNGEREELP